MIAKVRGLLRYSYSVPWCVPAWGRRELGATLGSLATAHVARGSYVHEFADGVRQFLGMSHALPVNRGRTAIELALRAMQIGAGDDVVLPSFVCQSVLDAVLLAGAHPVFADVDTTLNVSAATIVDALTPRTKAVIVVHLFGAAAPIDEIERILSARGVALIDDAAQALGARRAGRLVGTFGACGIVSAGPGKPLAGAAGGLLVTNDDRLFAAAAALPLGTERSSDVVRRAADFWIWRRLRRYTLPMRVILDRVVGERREPAHTSAALANLDAGIAAAQLARLGEHTAERRAHGHAMLRLLSNLPGESITDFSSDGAAVKLIWLLPREGPTVRDVVALLAEYGIEAQGGYSPTHVGHTDDARLPATVDLWSRVLCVPLETRAMRSAPIDFAALNRRAAVTGHAAGAVSITQR